MYLLLLLQMEHLTKRIDLLEDTIGKLIHVVKQMHQKQENYIEDFKSFTTILEAKIDRLLYASEAEEVTFKVISSKEDLEHLEQELATDASPFLNLFIKTGRNLSKIIAPEYLSQLSLINIKETSLYNKLFVPLCVKRGLNPDIEIAQLTRRSKNLMSKRKAKKNKQGKERYECLHYCLKIYIIHKHLFLYVTETRTRNTAQMKTKWKAI